jgi:hypothetical protein
MTRSMLASLSAVILVFVSAAPGDKDGERIKRLVDKPGAKIHSLPDLTTAAQSKLIARTAIGQDSLKSIRRYQADADGLYKVVLLDVPWRGKTVRLGVSTAPEGHLYRSGVFDDFGKPIDDFEAFLAQFSGQQGLTLTNASNEDIGKVIQRRDALQNAAKPPVKPADKKAWALLKHMHLMWRLDDAFLALEAARDEEKPLLGALKKLEERASEIAEFSDQLRPLVQPKTLGSYRGMLGELRANAAEAIALEEKGDADGARKIAKARLKMDCGKCHGSDQNEFKAPLQSAFRDQRRAAGFAAGAFVVDVDLRAKEWTPEEAQALASAVKACLLAAREE